MSRTDIHKPSVIIPANYEYVAVEYQKVEDLDDAMFLKFQRERIAAHMAKTGGHRSTHEHGGNCHVCGAHCIYTVLFWHKPTNVYIRTGFDCADKMDWDSGEGEAFRAKVHNALEARAGKKKAMAILFAKHLDACWMIYEATLDVSDWMNQGSDSARGNIKKEELIITDIVGKLVQYGNLSDKQFNFLGKLVVDIAGRAQKNVVKAAELEAAAPVPVTSDRILIKGKILAFRAPDPYSAFPVAKMLIQAETGYKLWGSRPSDMNGADKGDTIEFSAKVVPSRDDPKFGFYSRPTKVRKVV